MNIMITNDDGITAPGIIALAAALRTLGRVAVVAPDREQSAVSHAITLHHPLRAEQRGDAGAAPFGELVALYYEARFGERVVETAVLDALAAEVVSARGDARGDDGPRARAN